MLFDNTHVPRFLCRSLLALTILLTIRTFVSLYHLPYYPTTSAFDRLHWARKPALQLPTLLDQCPNITASTSNLSLDDILVVVKTGATEALSKLPVHFHTTLRCIPHAVIFSDLAEPIPGTPYTTHDALDTTNPTVTQTNPDFELYNTLRTYGRAGLNASDVASWTAAKNDASGSLGNPAWRLDKWKFLPLIPKALAQRPAAKWFVFMEADTYISWVALLEWLARFAPEKSWYLGNEMQIGDVLFGHGGSGFAISGPAMRALERHLGDNSEYYDDFTASQWAGDCVLGKALKDVGVQLHWSSPNFFGDSAASIDVTKARPNDIELGCYRVVSYHHMPPAEIEEFWQFEQDWNSQKRPLLRHRDVFEHHILPMLGTPRHDWDNLSEQMVAGDETGRVKSYNDCEKLCDAVTGCKQFTFTKKERRCRISKGVKLGGAAPQSGTEAGWRVDRIVEALGSGKQCADHQGWILP